MSLRINTFSNRTGGHNCFKALGHPLVAAAGAALTDRIRAAARPFAYDPMGQLADFAALYDLAPRELHGCFVRDTLALGKSTLGHTHRLITELPASGADLLFLAAFDAAPAAAQITHLLPPGCPVVTLDEMRLPQRLLTDKRNYLGKLNFATNFAFFRDTEDLHTRLVTANYWGGYGARDPFLWCRLFSENGAKLVDFEVPLGGPGESIVIDSRRLRAEHKLPEFCGQLFISVVNGAGHDIVKYVLDVYGAEQNLSCTHDANAWPAELYAGLPAPATDENVVLWIQNSHPRAIPPRTIRLNLMGETGGARVADEIPPFGSHALSITELLPAARWPQQLEIHAGKWFVRPRYEVLKGQRRRMNHVNVERKDLRHDRHIQRVAPHMGKGFLLPAPILPTTDYRGECLPTPMSTAQHTLPLIAAVYDADGREVARRRLGKLPRAHCQPLCLADLSGPLASGYGHVELFYDLEEDGVLDGWIHALFRYLDLRSGHVAETSFGSHIFNHVLTFRDEPQSYKGPPPGLSTRLFLRVAPAPARTFCHLIYPVSHTWHEHSKSRLELKNASGETLAQRELRIPRGGSRLFQLEKLFSEALLHQAGESAQVLVRDTTCRLFGYHGLRHGSGFALDHMFGF